MKTLTILLFLFASLNCKAQTFNFNQGGPDAKNYYQEIPYVNINGKLIVECYINGEKHRFLFDTGSPVTISTQLANEMHPRIIKKIGIGDAFERLDSTVVVEVNDLELGNIKFNHIPAATIGLPAFFKCLRVDGVIGSNLLRNSIVSIVPEKHIIIITNQKEKLHLKHSDGRRLISTIGYQSTPLILFSLKGKKELHGPIEFDTGDDVFLRIENGFVGMVNSYVVFDTLAKGFGADRISMVGTQDKGLKYLFKVAPIIIGKTKFDNLIIESNAHATSAIGSKLLDYGDITLDFIHQKFYFEAVHSVYDLKQEQWPFRPIAEKNKLLVGVVFNGADSLLYPGEQILAINGIDITDLTFCDFINGQSFTNGSGTTVLTIKDKKGSVRKVKIKKVSFL